MQKDSTYRINVYTFNKTLEFAERIKRIDVRFGICVMCPNMCCVSFWLACVCACVMMMNFQIQALEYIPFEGTVSLKSPQHVFCLLEDYGTDPNDIPENPYYIYFGRWVRLASLYFPNDK